MRHLRWHPLPDQVQEVLRDAVSRAAAEVEIEDNDGAYKILLRYRDGRFRDAQQQMQSGVRPIRRFWGDAEHYLRVVEMAKNIVLSTVLNMDEHATPLKKKRKEEGLQEAGRQEAGRQEAGRADTTENGKKDSNTVSSVRTT